MGDILNSFKQKKAILRLILSALIFFAVAIPFRKLFNLLPGITEIRPANVVPPVLALLWGPPAVVGITVGNLISDIMSGSNAFICTCGFIANFFYAYIPYKLWYSSELDEANIRPTLDNVGKILKYICIILLDSVVVTGILSIVFEAAGFNASGASYALLFFNNFDFSMILGVPILILVEKLKPDYYIPRSVRKKEGSYIGFDIFLLLSAFIGLAWFIISAISGSIVRSDIAGVLLWVSVALVIPCIFKPFNFDMKKQENKISDVKLTIKSKFTIGFLLLAVIFISIIGVTALNSHRGDDTLALWSYVYLIIGISINVIFAFAIVYLWYVEKNIVKPIEILTEATKKFADRPTDDDHEITEPELIRIDTKDELSSLANSFNTMMTDITNYMINLKAVTAEKERIGAELDVATTIQASMLPCIFPAFPERREFDIYASMQPAKEVGGDFYDFFLTDDNHLAMVMADVSGKGVPAALFMVIAKTMIKNSAQNGLSPKEVLEQVNNQLCENNEAGMFVTVWLGIMEISTGKMVCANAGHEYPSIKRKDGAFELLKDKHGFVLAGMEGARYREYEIELGAGDKLFVYTDGVAEATDKNNELFGTDRMIASLNADTEADCKKLLSKVQEGIDDFVGTAPQFDDITMLCIEYRGGEANEG